jgi:hypothetical protein
LSDKTFYSSLSKRADKCNLFDQNCMQQSQFIFTPYHLFTYKKDLQDNLREYVFNKNVLYVTLFNIVV